MTTQEDFSKVRRYIKACMSHASVRSELEAIDEACDALTRIERRSKAGDLVIEVYRSKASNQQDFRNVMKNLDDAYRETEIADARKFGGGE